MKYHRPFIASSLFGIIVLISGCNVNLLIEIEDAIAAANIVLYPEIALYYQTEGGEWLSVESGSTLDCGEVGEGNYDLIDFRIYNEGDGDLNLTSSRVSLSSTTDFSLSSQQPGSPVYPGSFEAFTLLFSPAGTGGKVVQSRIESNDQDESPYTFTLTGTCVSNPASGVPGNVAASEGNYSSYVFLSWDGVTGAINYVIYRSETATPPGSSGITTSMTTYFDEEAVPGTPYYYWVQAYVPDADPPLSELSDPDQGFRKLAAPILISGSGASDGSSTAHVSLDWNESAGAASYQIVRNTSETLSGASLYSSGTASWNDEDAVPARRYFYCLRAYSSLSDSYSDYSGWDSGYRAPLAPTGVTATDNSSTSGVQISWNGVGGDIDQYLIYRNTEDNPAGGSIFTSATSPYTDTDTYFGRLYYYWVKASNSSEGITGSFSEPDTGNSRLPTPTDPSTSSGGYKSYVESFAVLTWDAYYDEVYPQFAYLFEDGFRVYRSLSSSGPWTDASGLLDRYNYFSYEYSTNAQRLSYYDASVPAGIWYYYQVRATTRTGGRMSDPTTPLPAYRPLPAPANIYATDNDPAKITVTWDTVSGAARYKVVRERVGGMEYTVLGHTTATSWVDTTAEAGKVYTYIIYAVQDVEPAHEGEPGWYAGGSLL